MLTTPDLTVILSCFLLGPEQPGHVTLEEQLTTLEEMLRYKKRQIQDLQQELQVSHSK